jgi:hypothetical protein
MHSLSDLRDLLVERGYKIKEFGGWYLDVGKDRYTMLDGDYYLNKNRLTKKELLAKLRKK